MTHYFALHSLVFMMGFVAVFDGFHRKSRVTRILRSINLFTSDEVNRLQAIWEACQE